ncbi:helix-turn-helix transcriptional regulator [Streptomyces sp. NPDC006267]|uniref:helix-turn-helix domain-containing protein n=1 Tax=Streptomyces sp. NPDC006267 TaxID=3157173 RepID=UPI0033BE3B78
MGRWRPLAAELPMEHRRLVQRLRILKDRTGLSYAALAAKSPCSAASWHRYLNAAAFPPWDAVSALCRLAGGNATDLARLRVLWDAAGNHRLPDAPRRPGATGRPEGTAVPDTAPAPAPAPPPPTPTGPPPPDPSPPGARRTPALLRGAAAALTLALLASVPASTIPEASVPNQTWPVPARLPAASAARPAPCLGQSCDGLDAARAGCVHDRRVLGSYVRDGHRTRLVHSPGCSAVWGEAEPSQDVRALTLSVRGAGQEHEPAGAARTRMAPAPERLGTNVQFCAVFREFQSCIDAGNRVWSGAVRPEEPPAVTARRPRTP